MWFVFIALTLLFVTLRADLLDVHAELACGPDADPCPANSRCVPGAGCVSLDASPQTCRCNKDRPCPWSQKCDCKGGCEALRCTTTSGCGRQLVNPRNACQKLNCSASSHTCVVTAVHCASGARCDRQRGCAAAEEVEASSRGSLSVRDIHAHTDAPDASPGRHNAWVIGLIVIMSLFAALWLIFAGYAMYLAWNPKSRKAGNI